jgi:hypothetical protein
VVTTKAVLCVLVAGTGLVIWAGSSRHAAATRPEPTKPYEAPSLSREAAAQLVRRDGGPGPLFEPLTLGGPAPAPELRARIAEFAKQNHVQIDLEVDDDELVAIRVDVTFRGGFGYENADMFALALGHPHTGGCTGPDTWIDDWAFVTDDGVHALARARINRVQVRWEPVASAAALVERADGLLGKDVATVARHARDRWVELESNHRFVVEMPLSEPRFRWRRPEGLDAGIVLGAHAGRIEEVSVSTEYYDVDDAMRARWGTPHEYRDNDMGKYSLTWRRPDRVVTWESSETLTIKSR